jgi:hypothetical protein
LDLSNAKKSLIKLKETTKRSFDGAKAKKWVFFDEVGQWEKIGKIENF